MNLEVKHSDLDKEYLEEIKKDYDAIINTGISPGRNAISVEKIALNWQDDMKDEDGLSARVGRIVKDAPDGLFSRLQTEEILHSLRSAKIPSELSFLAGTFVCNKIFYYSLYYTKAKAGFIHFPLDSESSFDGRYPTMSIDNMIKSIEMVIQKTI